MSATRRERDSFGGIEVPADRLWGAQTQRSLEHFSISNERLPEDLVLALVAVKAAAARVTRVRHFSHAIRIDGALGAIKTILWRAAENFL